tara:strand:+ start:3896 stop:4165 length:270 start_codon:yes stop_codon:yes gene_type:complete
MNQTTAKKKAYEGNVRVGYLRELLNKANNTGMCKINPSLPRAKAIEMFLAGLEGRDDNDTPNTTMIGRRDRITLNVFGMTVKNILAEFG